MSEPTGCPCRAQRSGTITRCYCRMKTVHAERPCGDCARGRHMDEYGNPWRQPSLPTVESEESR